MDLTRIKLMQVFGPHLFGVSVMFKRQEAKGCSDLEGLAAKVAFAATKVVVAWLCDCLLRLGEAGSPHCRSKRLLLDGHAEAGRRRHMHYPVPCYGAC